MKDVSDSHIGPLYPSSWTLIRLNCNYDCFGVSWGYDVRAGIVLCG